MPISDCWAILIAKQKNQNTLFVSREKIRLVEIRLYTINLYTKRFIYFRMYIINK